MKAFHVPRILLASVLLFMAAGSRSTTANDSPRFVLPAGLQWFDVGRTIYLHGSPMRVQGFVTGIPPAILLERLRESLGQPLVEDRLGAQTILGRAQDEHYLTVQFEAAGSGSRGLVAVASLKAASDTRSAMRERSSRLLARLPADSHLVSDMVSQDGNTHSRHLLILNRHDPALNAQNLKSLMAEEGYQLQAPSNQAALSSSERGVLLFFQAPGKHAMASVQRQGDGQTAIVLNLLTIMEHQR